jgi:hypothetical protein
MNNFNTWNVNNKYINQEYKLYINCNPELKHHHLLDTTKTNFTLLEKFIYDTSLFHFNRLSIDNTDDYYIEFWCKSKYDVVDNNIHIDCDSELQKTNNFYFPLLSCITYFTNNTITPTLISNVDLDTYKYKNFVQQQSIALSLPKINKQITFEGHFYHGNTSLSECDDTKELYIVYVNLWNKKPKNMEYYLPKYETKLYNKQDVIATFQLDNAVCKIKVSEDIINYNFFNNLLYEKRTDVCYKFNELIINYNIGDTTNSTFVFELDIYMKHKIQLDIMKKTHGDVIEDIEAIANTTTNIKYNRFLQRFTFNNVYSPDLSCYIINECEIYAKQNKGFNAINNTANAINIKYIPSVFGIVKTTLDNTIMNKIINSYNMDNKLSLSIVDLFVVKCKCDGHNSLKINQRCGFFTFSILLSDDFTGGGLHFDDGLNVYLKQGELLIHNSNINHSVLPITNGICYILVGFVDLEVYV